MNSEIKKLMKTFKSKSKDKDKYNEFLYYCHQAFDSKKYKKSKKMINKYDILRQDLLRYLIANETAVKAELNK
tara:strand:+ start:47 stop:265 length:219 start_codon:yes stop_codon:yes gene_type:complete